MITIVGDIKVHFQKPEPMSLDELLDPRLIQPVKKDMQVTATFNVPYEDTIEFTDMLRKYGLVLG